MFVLEVYVFPNQAAAWFQSHQHNADAACEHCGGIVVHEKWCITCDPAVQYAYEVVLNPDKMTLRDQLILHALGVSWVQSLRQGACSQWAFKVAD